jgi:hypothetical protein
LKVEIEVRVELNYYRRKEIAEDAANYIARGEACSKSASVQQTISKYVWRVVMQILISSRQSVHKVVVVGLVL